MLWARVVACRGADARARAPARISPRRPPPWSRAWELRRRINEVTQQITGTLHALEQIQEDTTQIHLLYLTAQHQDPAKHSELCGSGGGNTQRARNLLDAYVTEFHALHSGLVLAAKQVCTVWGSPATQSLPCLPALTRERGRCVGS